MVRALFTAFAALLLFAGCTKLGPDFRPPKAPQVSSEIPRDTNVSEAELAGWWHIYDDPVLDRLVERAAAQNLDLRAAGLRILQARAALGIATGLQYPQTQQLNGAYTFARQSGHRIDTANLSFDVGWELDLWGRYARGIERAEAALMASVAGYRALTVSLLAEVARLYIDYRTTEERIAYARRNVAIQTRVTAMTKVQYEAGNVSELDMQQARTQLYNTRAGLPAMELAKVKIVNALALLLGTTPERIRPILARDDGALQARLNEAIATGKGGVVQLDEKDVSALDLRYIPAPHFDPNRVVDAALLTHRPDVKAAEYLAHAIAAQIGVAESDLYPSIRLFGSIGYSATDRNPLLPDLTGWGRLSDNLVAAAGPGISWKIFDYGRIKNQVRLQDAKFQEALINYSKTVLAAATEVSNALAAYRLAQRQLKERQAALAATIRAFNISVTQYHDGLVSYQRLLSTVEKLTLAQDAYARTKGELAADIALLYKTLGGGWQITDNRSYLNQADRKAMKKRGVDWANGLDENQTKLGDSL